MNHKEIVFRPRNEASFSFVSGSSSFTEISSFKSLNDNKSLPSFETLSVNVRDSKVQ